VLRIRVALVASVVLATACQVPRFEGPQIQEPPPAFSMKRDVTQERRMFPARAVVFHEAWVEASWGNFSGIYINGHPGNLGRGEVEAAQRQAILETQGQRVEIGPLESLDVDGRTAWGWGETWRLENGGLQYVVFRAAVPYDTVTYAVDFLTGDPGLKLRPDSLRTVVASFAVGRIRWNVPLLLIAAGVLLFLLNLGRRRANERAARARHVPLVKIRPKQTDEGTRGTASTTGTMGATGADAPAPTATPEMSVAEAIRKKVESRDRGPA